jgi:hypothetical protein
MYRLCKRLDAGTAFEDDMLRLNKKIEALAQVKSRTTYSKLSDWETLNKGAWRAHPAMGHA